MAQHHPEIKTHYTDGLKIKLKGSTYGTLLNLFNTDISGIKSCQDKCVLIDDAHHLYDDIWFWEGFFKGVNRKFSGIYMILATSYGSPGQFLNPNPELLSPAALCEKYHVALQFQPDTDDSNIYLNFTEEEALEVSSGILCDLPYADEIEEELVGFVRNMTNGHPAAFYHVLRICL